MKTWNITQLVKIARNDTPWVRRHLKKAGIVPVKHIIINDKDWSKWGKDAFDWVTEYRNLKDGRAAAAAAPKAATYNITTLRRVAAMSAYTLRTALYAAGITEVEKHELTPTGKDYSRWGQNAYDFAFNSNPRNKALTPAPADPVQTEMPFPLAPPLPDPALAPGFVVRGVLATTMEQVRDELVKMNDKFDRMLAVWEK